MQLRKRIGQRLRGDRVELKAGGDARCAPAAELALITVSASPPVSATSGRVPKRSP